MEPSSPYPYPQALCRTSLGHPGVFPYVLELHSTFRRYSGRTVTSWSSRCLGTVSYTHLDVYKRQALSSEAKKNETSQNISESDTEQNAAANENQPQDSNSDPSSPGAGNPDEKADDTEDNSAEDPNAPSDGTVSDQPADELSLIHI